MASVLGQGFRTPFFSQQRNRLLWRGSPIPYAKLYTCYYFDSTAKTPLVIHMSSTSHSELGTALVLFPKLSHAEGW